MTMILSVNDRMLITMLKVARFMSNSHSYSCLCCRHHKHLQNHHFFVNYHYKHFNTFSSLSSSSGSHYLSTFRVFHSANSIESVKKVIEARLTRRTKMINQRNLKSNPNNLNAVYHIKNIYTNLTRINEAVSKPQWEHSGDLNGWQCKLTLSYPDSKSFVGVSKRKKEAEVIASQEALSWLKDQGVVTRDFQPILHTSQQLRKFMVERRAPININPLSVEIREKMYDYLNTFDVDVRDMMMKEIAKRLEEDERFKIDYNSIEDDNETNGAEELMSSSQSDNFSSSSQSDIIFNVLTGKPYVQPSDVLLRARSLQLKNYLKNLPLRETIDSYFKHTRAQQAQLPIQQYRQKISEMLQQNQVIVISGETGCGKTTQVPRYIFEDYIENNKGGECNIVITQPRRLPAIAIAERVSTLFGESSLGQSIGYQVRFDKKLPSYPTGGMLFCSAGILLRKLENNPDLKGVSHVIVDEVHERDVITDFLLILLKRLIQRNPNLRIVLMSASMNAQLFSQYFDNCPIIEVPGRCFPVEQFYLPDVCNMIGLRNPPEESLYYPKISKELIVLLAHQIDHHKPEGAILCFLPGWKEIQEVAEELEKQRNNFASRLLILPVHSKLPHHMQRLIFEQPPVGTRKVILSTNIAETSLTIDDVVYVIDPGLCNEIHYDKRFNVSTFGTHWISQANARQRQGRAGRVKPGECYRLYSQEIFNSVMDDFPSPEMLRIPLERIIMEAKLFCPKEKAATFLSQSPQSPTIEAILSALEELKSINVLDDAERLTPLGKRIAHFTTHPRLSVSLVMATMMGCLYPMLNVTALLTATREPFDVMPDAKRQVREIKEKFSQGWNSDHVALFNLSIEYEDVINWSRGELTEFCILNSINQFAFNNILASRKIYAQHLEDARLVERNTWNDLNSYVNVNRRSKNLLISALIPGLFPNVIRLMKGDVKNGKIKLNAVAPIDVRRGKAVRFATDSLLHGKPDQEELESRDNGFAIYFNSFYSEEIKRLTVKDATLVKPLSLLLFAKKSVEHGSYVDGNKENADQDIYDIDGNPYLKFKLQKEDAQLIDEWRNLLIHFSNWFVTRNTENDKIKSQQNEAIENSFEQFIEITEDLLETSS